MVDQSATLHPGRSTAEVENQILFISEEVRLKLSHRYSELKARYCCSGGKDTLDICIVTVPSESKKSLPSASQHSYAIFHR